MRAVDWHVLRELLALRARFNEFFERALLPEDNPTGVAPGGTHEPPADVWQDEDRLVVELELPGVASADLDVRLEGDDLVVTGRSSPDTPPGSGYLQIERPRGRFSRRIRLPVEVTGSPGATLGDGVLTVTLKPAARERRIPVEHGGLN